MKQKQSMYLSAEAIYRFLTGTDDKLDTLITCQSSEVNLVTTDQSLYEAVGAINDKNDINYNKLVKLLEVTRINHFPDVLNAPRKILTEDRAQDIRAGKGGN